MLWHGRSRVGVCQLLYRNVQRFRGGLVFKAHRRLYHSTLGLRVIKKKKFAYRTSGNVPTAVQHRVLTTLKMRRFPMVMLKPLLVSGFGFQVSGFRFQVSGFGSDAPRGFRQGFLVSGFWFLVSGFWFLVSGFRFQVSGWGRMHPARHEPRDRSVLPIRHPSSPLALAVRPVKRVRVCQLKKCRQLKKMAHLVPGAGFTLQGYLAHKKTPAPGTLQ